jgi:Tfp pilus assembly protein PilF
MTDHLADVKKYAKKPVNEAALSAMEKAYRLVLSQPDSRYVACSDPAELETVRENFLKKRLGLSSGDLGSGDLDGAVKAVCEAMKQDRTKSRLTFYYLLAEHFDKLNKFT